MSAELRERLRRVASDRPVGQLTPVANGKAKDEYGRIYYFESVEQKETRIRSAALGRDQRVFSFSHMQHMKDITTNLSNKYCGYILLLQPYISFKSGMLVNDEKPLKIAEIGDILGITKRTAQTLVKELELRSILFETDGTFTINSRYHFRKRAGDEVDALIKTFFTPLKRIKLTTADLGFLYKLLPHVHLDTNVICADPFVENPEDVRFLNERSIAEIVGMNVDKARETMKRLHKAGVIGEWTMEGDGREKLTVLNPYVFYRKAGEPDGLLRTLFAAKQFKG